MDDDVVTVMWGEFGRTPKINGNDAGRDHWSPVMCAHGRRRRPEDGPGGRRQLPPAANTRRTGPYKVPHVLSTIYHAMGIDPATTFPNGTGRPMYILDDRNKVEELM